MCSGRAVPIPTRLHLHVILRGMLTSKPADTASRLDALATYMTDEVLSPARCGDGDFVCESRDDCKCSLVPRSAFFEGQLSHVGAHYDLFENGRPLRVVVVGQESAAGPRRITLDARTAMVMESALLRRFKADGNYKARNPHMRGTTSALRLLLGGEVGDDHNGEFIVLGSGERVHMFDAFALVNVLLCGAHPPRSTQGRSTPKMRENCLRHFKATLRILEPTVIVLQGIGVQDWTRDVFENVTPVGEQAAWAQFEGSGLYLCNFSHPSAQKEKNWGSGLKAPYLPIVERTL